MIIFYSGMHRPSEFPMLERLSLPPTLMATFHDAMPEGRLVESGVAMVLKSAGCCHGDLLQRQRRGRGEGQGVRPRT